MKLSMTETKLFPCLKLGLKYIHHFWEQKQIFKAIKFQVTYFYYLFNLAYCSIFKRNLLQNSYFKFSSTSRTLRPMMYPWNGLWPNLTKSEPCQTFNIELLAKIVNRFQLMTIFAKSSILYVWQFSEYPLL